MIFDGKRKNSLRRKKVKWAGRGSPALPFDHARRVSCGDAIRHPKAILLPHRCGVPRCPLGTPEAVARGDTAGDVETDVGGVDRIGTRSRSRNVRGIAHPPIGVSVWSECPGAFGRG